MKELQKSTWIFIGLIVAILILGTTLFLTMPEEWKSHFSEGQFLHNECGFKTGNGQTTECNRQTTECNGHENFKNCQRNARFGHSRGHSFGFILILIALASIFLITRKNHQRCDASLTILEEQFAEGKISEEEFKRKKAVLMQGGKK
jgi:uncharacterized membrane protein